MPSALKAWRPNNSTARGFPKIHFLKVTAMGFPWWLSGKESTCQCRKHGFEPRSRRIPHAAEQLSPCPTLLSLSARARESQLLKPEFPRAREAAATRSLSPKTRESSPCSPKLETAQHKDPAQPNVNKII